MSIRLFFLLLLVEGQIVGQTLQGKFADKNLREWSVAIYVSPTGNDTNPGTFDQPYKTLAKALSVAGPDSLIYLRGGTYIKSSTETISKSGLPGKYIKIWAYPGETPVFDFSLETSSDGIKLSGSYCHLRGLEAIKAYHNGINISGNNNIVEACLIHENRNSGLQIGSSSGSLHPRNNFILNCDSYYNYDAPIGGNADGFAIKWNIGSNNLFRGCRAFNNSDDGFDFWMAESLITLDSCYAFRNGVDSWGQPGFDGNGNGFKLGGHYIATPNIVTHCLSFDNSGNSGRGFDENNNTAGQTLYNCTAYRNHGDNYHFTDTGVQGQHVIKNCISYQGIVNITSGTRQNNSWQGFTVTNADFSSLDTSLAVAPRNPDGNLPANDFFRLAQGSSMIDAGIYVGLPYNGTAPDLGAFEFGTFSYYTLAVDADNGTVIKNPDQPSYCSGITVQLTAIPAAGYHFTGWSGDTSGLVNPLSIIMTSDREITAGFAINQYSLNLSVAGNGNATKEPDQTLYDYHTSVILTAMTSTGWHFIGWTGTINGMTNPVTVFTDSAMDVTANFAIDIFRITVSKGGHGTITPSDSALVQYDRNQRFIFAPDRGYHIDSILVDGVNIPDSTAGYTFETVRSPHMLRVVFGTNSNLLYVNERWNMVSLPSIGVNPAKTALFPRASSPAYMFTGQYTISDTFYNGVGYWLKFPSKETVLVLGSELPVDTIAVRKGWNIIGSVSKPVPVSSIVSIPPHLVTGNFFGYTGRYVPSDTIQPGKAYWMKAGQEGSLILSSVPKDLNPAARLRIIQTNELPPDPPEQEVLSSNLLPEEYLLEQNYPNPFNPSTVIEVGLPHRSDLELRVFDLLGRQVAEIASGIFEQGYHRFKWSGISDAGLRAGAGAYFYKLDVLTSPEGKRYTIVRSMVIVK